MVRIRTYHKYVRAAKLEAQRVVTGTSTSNRLEGGNSSCLYREIRIVHSLQLQSVASREVWVVFSSLEVRFKKGRKYGIILIFGCGSVKLEPSSLAVYIQYILGGGRVLGILECNLPIDSF